MRGSETWRGRGGAERKRQDPVVCGKLFQLAADAEAEAEGKRDFHTTRKQ